MNKKASAQDILYLCVLLLVGSIVFFVGHRAYTEMNDHFQNVTMLSSQGRAVLNNTATMIGSGHLLDYAFITIFIMLTIGILLLAYVNDFSPAYLVLFIVVLIITLIVSIQFSNAFYTIRTHSEFTTTAASYPMMQYIMENLPYVILVIGILFGLVIYSKFRSRGVYDV